MADGGEWRIEKGERRTRRMDAQRLRRSEVERETEVGEVPWQCYVMRLFVFVYIRYMGLYGFGVGAMLTSATRTTDGSGGW